MNSNITNEILNSCLNLFPSQYNWTADAIQYWQAGDRPREVRLVITFPKPVNLINQYEHLTLMHKLDSNNTPNIALSSIYEFNWDMMNEEQQ